MFWQKQVLTKTCENFKVNNLVTFFQNLCQKCGQVIDLEVAKLLTLKFSPKTKNQHVKILKKKNLFYGF